MAEYHKTLAPEIAKASADQLVELVCRYAPSTEDSDLVRSVYRDMVDAGIEGDELVRSIAHWLTDGLQHGNWPWLTYSRAGYSAAYKAWSGKS
jgi:hypothetical protein